MAACGSSTLVWCCYPPWSSDQSLCKHCLCSFSCTRMGKSLCYWCNILDLARPRCTCCKLERCGGWSLKVTPFFCSVSALLSLMSVQYADYSILSFACIDWSFPSGVGWMCFVPFQLVNLAWMPEITCNLLLKEVGATILHCCCVNLSLKWNLEITLRHCPHMLLPLMFRNITQSSVLLATWGCKFAAFLEEFFFFWPFGACKLQSKMAWNVDAVVRYLSACLWR